MLFLKFFSCSSESDATGSACDVDAGVAFCLRSRRFRFERRRANNTMITTAARASSNNSTTPAASSAITSALQSNCSLLTSASTSVTSLSLGRKLRSLRSASRERVSSSDFEFCFVSVASRCGRSVSTLSQMLLSSTERRTEN